MIVTIGLAVLVMLALAGAFAVLLGWANVRWKIEVPPQLGQLIDALPGVNCGACGFVGCAEYAEAVLAGAAPPDKCPVGGAPVARRLAEIMGVEVADSAPYRPVVHCAANYDARLKLADYYGELTCGSANMISGVQGCTYGCLGLGDCERACPFDAIHMVHGLARVDYERCTGCGACERSCPRHIISMVPFKADRVAVVTCSNRDPPKVVRTVCTVGCIGCGVCAKLNELFNVTANLAEVDYDRYDPEMDFGAVMEKCPRNTIVFIGRPSPEHLASVAEEELPERVEPDFRSTVDRSEWHG